MAKTTASLLDYALAIVSQVGAGQVADDDDRQQALKALESLLAELGHRGILTLYIDPNDLDAEDIPDHLFQSLANVLAADLQTVFSGASVADDTREGLINRVRRLTYIKGTGETVRAKYF